MPADFSLGSDTTGPAENQAGSQQDGDRQTPARDSAEGEDAENEEENQPTLDQSVEKLYHVRRGPCPLNRCHSSPFRDPYP